MDQEEVNNTTSAPAEASKKKVTKKKEAKPKKVKTEVDTAPETTESAPQEATETPKTEPDTTAPDAPVDGATPADGAPATETKKKRRSKRKKSATDAAAGTPNQPKIAKESDAAESAGTETKEGETPTTEVKKKKKNRWILFVGVLVEYSILCWNHLTALVGNLPYDADKEMIEGHFEPCGMPTTNLSDLQFTQNAGRIVGVRLLTEKDSNKSRGMLHFRVLYHKKDDRSSHLSFRMRFCRARLRSYHTGTFSPSLLKRCNNMKRQTIVV